MNPIEPTPHASHDLDADLTTLARTFREPYLSDRDRLRVAGNVVACIRARHRLGAYGKSPRGRDGDLVRDLALPTPN